jgi:hypothetical protein
MEKQDVLDEVAELLKRSPYEVERLAWRFFAEYAAVWMRRYVANGEGYAQLWLEENGVAE